MQPDICPLCQSPDPTRRMAGGFDEFDCELCGSFCIDDRLVSAPTTLDRDLWPNLRAAVRELQLRHPGTPYV